MSVVLRKEYHEKIIKKLRNRFAALLVAAKGRLLISPSEGVKRHGHWVHPENMIAINSKLDKDLAVEDFKNILVEIKKLK